MTLDIGLAARVISGIRAATPNCPDWDTPGIAAALREVGGTPGAALAAAALAAEDAALTKPSATAFKHHWPTNAGISAPRVSMDVRCPEHSLNVHPCAECAAKRCEPTDDYLAAKAELAARRPIPTTQKRLADFAAAKETES